MLDEPRSGRLAAWGNALFAALVSPDDAAQRIVGDDVVHRVVGLPASPGPYADSEPEPVGLTLALGRLRSMGARGLRVALPVPGHPLGLSGPPEFNSRALDAGEAVIAAGAGVGLVPELYEAGPEGDVHSEVTWHCLSVREAPPADVPSLSEAERELAEAMRDATEVLTELDVAGSGPVAAAALETYRARMEAGRQLLAPGYPPRAVRVLELAQRVRALVAIAYGEEDGTGRRGGGGEGGDGREHGGAVSASQIAARAEALRPVERTARRAQVAAYNAYAEELERKSWES
ncbi:hypothetical protein G4Z16_27500 [Streptomyces bathyalis]|uniref:Uncharacterized protein n=1 Tax=Streptomyces bathyalis TaxID=2710756 RepID=A0A7T1TAR1_9ACTN|nr:hypothetical protein [Streptomyces bathyalis]QPP09541.1 hypothetical protein G4Z16_27500 [Streptomyces bathyalis]